MATRLLLLSLLGLNFACNDMASRPETADKWKPILVLVNPPAAAISPVQPLSEDARTKQAVAGDTVNLALHFIGPEDADDSLTLSIDTAPDLPLSYPLSDWQAQGDKVVTVYPGLKHVIFNVQTTLPSSEQIKAVNPLWQSQGLTRSNYAFALQAGDRAIPVNGDFVVYQDAALASQVPLLYGSRIESPAQGAALSGKKLDITSRVYNPAQESIKLGWFVSAGEIKNRRAAETDWELPGSGRFTLVLTVRGKDSRNADIQIREVTIP